MKRSHREPVVAVDLAPGSKWTVERHVALRVEHVVTQVARTHRGLDPDAVAGELTVQFRALGVPSAYRRVEHYAEAISRLPAAAPRPGTA